jgi:hypothetical protein
MESDVVYIGNVDKTVIVEMHKYSLPVFILYLMNKTHNQIWTWRTVSWQCHV